MVRMTSHSENENNYQIITNSKMQLRRNHSPSSFKKNNNINNKHPSSPKPQKERRNSPSKPRRQHQQQRQQHKHQKQQQQQQKKPKKHQYSKKRSTKPHDAPMGKRDIYFALDCEMVGVGPDGTESALAKVTIVNWDNEIVLDTHVRVPVPVTNYRTHVSGITQQDVESENAIPIDECRTLVQSILKGKILIGHALENDLKVLHLQHPWCDIRDTAYYAPYMKVHELPSSSLPPVSKDDVVSGVVGGTIMCPRKLRDLAWEKLERVIQVEGKSHSALEDAIAALDLYKASRSEWEDMLSKRVMTLNEMETSAQHMNQHERVVQPLSQPRTSHNVRPMNKGLFDTFPTKMSAASFSRRPLYNNNYDGNSMSVGRSIYSKQA